MLNVRFPSPYSLTSQRKSSDTFNCGNILSVANTAKFHSTDSYLADINNTAVIAVGKNLLFLVAKGNMSTNQEILTEYGLNDDPTPYRPISIKQASII